MSFSNDGSSGDEVPNRGHVKDVTRDWLLRTDEEFAHRLQDEEITKHLCGNRHRNGQIREDFPAAAAAQRRAEEKARRKARLQKRQAEEDAQVARELQALQQLELQKGRPPHSIPHGTPHSPPRLTSDHLSNFASQLSDHLSCVNSNSYPENFLMPETSKHDTSNNNEISLSDNGPREMKDLMREAAFSGQLDVASGDSTKYLEELEAALGVSREQLHQEQTRLLQEERDAELARLLGSKGKNDPLEVRDGELARLLQNREYERFRKLKEKQKARSIQKQMMKNSSSENRNIDNAAELGDTYCQPCDLISVPTRPIESECVDTYSTLAENQEDPYYMEPFQSRANFQEQSVTSNILNKETKSFRPPPAPPRSAGRPKMAEPSTSLVMEKDPRKNPPKEGIVKDTAHECSEEDPKRQLTKKGQSRQQQKGSCRQQ